MARPLKARELYKLMAHAVGGTFSSQLREQDMANDALEQVASMHTWSFLDSGEAYLDLRGSQSFTDWTWTATGRVLSDPLTSNALAPYTWQPGDLVHYTSPVAGYAKVEEKLSDNSLKLATSISATNITADLDGRLELRTALFPADFRKLLSVGFDTGTNVVAHIKVTSAQEVARWQRQLLQPLSYYYACSERVVLSDGTTRHLLRMAPATSSAITSALHCIYERRIPAIESDSDTIQVPEYLHVLVKQTARAWARSLEMPKTWGSFEEQLEAIVGGQTFKLARQADDGVSEEIGPITGGHLPAIPSGLDDFPFSHNIAIGGPT